MAVCTVVLVLVLVLLGQAAITHLGLVCPTGHVRAQAAEKGIELPSDEVKVKKPVYANKKQVGLGCE